MRRIVPLIALAAIVGSLFVGAPAGATATTPGPPRAVSVATSFHAATVAWLPPASNGGASIIGYRISSEMGVTDVGASVRSAKIDLAENGAQYHVTVSARNSVGLGQTSGTDAVPRPNGYWMLDLNGNVYSFGQVSLGSARTLLGERFVHIESSRSGDQYWTVTDRGSVLAFAFENGTFGSDAIKVYPASTNPGSPDPPLSAGERVVSLSRVNAPQTVCFCFTKVYESYWLFTNRGRVIPLGHAKFYGDLSHLALSKPIVGSVATPTGKGYYMVAADGGVFSFGDAKFHGSTGNLHLNAPVTGLVPNADNSGYWLVASDGGIFAFHAPFRGSMGGARLNRPINGMVRFGNGYLMVASDGGVFDFSNKRFYGSLADQLVPAPVVSIAASG